MSSASVAAVSSAPFVPVFETHLLMSKHDYIKCRKEYCDDCLEHPLWKWDCVVHMMAVEQSPLYYGSTLEMFYPDRSVIADCWWLDEIPSSDYIYFPIPTGLFQGQNCSGFYVF
jgi:hypothetical protein